MENFQDYNLKNALAHLKLCIYELEYVRNDIVEPVEELDEIKESLQSSISLIQGEFKELKTITVVIISVVLSAIILSAIQTISDNDFVSQILIETSNNNTNIHPSFDCVNAFDHAFSIQNYWRGQSQTNSTP